jgi:hypothetical protein
MEIAAVVDSGTEQLILFRMERLPVFSEDVADFPTGDINSPFGQLLQYQWLSDTLMVMLVEDITFEGSAEVLSL